MVDSNLNMPVHYLKISSINKQRGKLKVHGLQHMNVAILSDLKSKQGKACEEGNYGQAIIKHRLVGVITVAARAPKHGLQRYSVGSRIGTSSTPVICLYGHV